MNFINKILGMVGLETKGQSLPIAQGTSVEGAFSVWATGKKVPAARAMQVYNAWAYACIRAIAEELAKIEFKLYKVKGQKSEEIMEHELLDLLYGVNPHQTRYELFYNIAAHLEMTGNSYIYLDGVKNDTQKPSAIYCLPPQYIKVIKKPIPEFLAGYKYTVDGSERKLETYEVVHLKYPDPADPYEGIGTVQAIADWIDTDNYATNFNTNFFKNGAKIGGTLESENATTIEQQKLLKTSFENLYKGAGNAYKVAVLPKGVKYNELGSTPKDMDFANLQAVMRDKILAGFRVPKTILGTSESETNRATAETANYVFSERTIKPKMELITQMLNEFLVPRYGDDLYLEYVSPTPDDLEAKMRELAAALPQQASISINEAREKYFGLGPITGGDMIMGSFNLIPIGKPIAEKGESGAVRSKDVKGKSGRGKSMTRAAKNARTRKEMSEEITDRAMKGIEEAFKDLGKIKRKALQDITSLTDDDYEVIYKAFFGRVTPYEKLVAESVRKFNKQQAEVVVKNLSDKLKTKTKAIDPEDLLGGEDWPSILATLVGPELADLYEKEAVAAAELIGTTFTMTPELRAALDKALALMADSYNETTIQLLDRVLEDGISNGLPLDEITQNVQNIYEFSDQVRAEQVARTEVFRVANESTRSSWKQSGVVKTLKWYTAADERVCPYCEPMHKEVVGIDETFYDKGDTVTGTDGTKLDLTYSDVAAPPLHVSCRCYIRPDEVSIE